MECSVVQPELVLYHFGTIAPDARAGVEQHLLSCRECLTGFLALKRHLESEPEAGPRPSAQARLELRAAVEREFARPLALEVRWRRATSWGLAAAAAAVIAFVAFQGVQHSQLPPPSAGDSIPVDSAYPGAAGLTVL